jgi:lysozyme
MSTGIKIFLISFFAIMFLVCSGAIAYKYKGIAYNTIHKHQKKKISNKRRVKIQSVVSDYPQALYGIDISHYQGHVNWNKVAMVHKEKPIQFVFLRATMGIRKDKHYDNNWSTIKRKKFVRAAYHYYNPNLNSALQANHFIETVKLQKGDLPPILDIEKTSIIQSNARLLKGLKNWIRIIEEHYGIKPIIYTGEHFYTRHLKNNGFDDYHLWIANYSAKPSKNTKWKFWQFSETGRVIGFENGIDLNVYNGDLAQLKTMCLP